jgi:hypothetical protein
VIEALLEGGAPAKIKARVLQRLRGSYGRVALTAAGSFVVEKCYGLAEADVKVRSLNVFLTHRGPDRG